MTEYVKRWDNFGPQDIPEAILHELIDAAGMGEKECVRIGRAVQAMLETLEAEKVRVPTMRLYKAVASVTGRSASTVRMYSDLVKHVPPKMWGAHPELSHQVYRELLPICRDSASMWESYVADWLQHCASTGARPGSVDGIAGWLLGTGGQAPAYWKKYRTLLRMAEQLASDNQVHDEVRRVCRRMIDHLEKKASENKEMEEWKPSRHL